MTRFEPGRLVFYGSGDQRPLSEVVWQAADQLAAMQRRITGGELESLDSIVLQLHAVRDTLLAAGPVQGGSDELASRALPDQAAVLVDVPSGAETLVVVAPVWTRPARPRRPRWARPR